MSDAEGLARDSASTMSRRRRDAVATVSRPVAARRGPDASRRDRNPTKHDAPDP